MFNPLVDNFSSLSDSQIDEKILELSKKYHMSRNLDVQNQIAVILDMFREESRLRSAKQMQKLNNNGDESLDNLINVS